MGIELFEDRTVQDVYNELSQKKKDILHYLVGIGIQKGSFTEEDLAGALVEFGTIPAFTDEEQRVAKYLISTAIANR